MKKWFVLISACLVTFMMGVSATALNIAIPVIAEQFYANMVSMQWVINSFYLTSAMVQILGGNLGDYFGHRRIFLINLTLFILCSLGAGVAMNQKSLILFRALQGATIGIAYPQTIVLIAVMFPKDKQSYARGFVIGAMGIAMALGTPLGGLFVTTLGWRWIFFINVPIGLLSLLLIWLNCVCKERNKVNRIDFKGTSLLVLGLFGIIYGLNEVQTIGFTSPKFLTFLMGGVFLLLLLYRNERKKPDPIVDFFLFTDRTFLINNILRFISQIIFLSVLFLVPLYLQNVAGITATMSGMTLMTLTLMMAITSPIAGHWVDKKGSKMPGICCMISFMIASVLLFFTEVEPNFILLIIALVLFGFSTATSLISTLAGCINNIPDEKLGRATGMYFTVAWLGCAIGIAFAGTMMAYVSSSYFLAEAAAKNIHLAGHELQTALRAAKGVFPVSSLPDLKEIVSVSFIEGFRMNALRWVQESSAP